MIDEVSYVLQHFRPKPEFAVKGFERFEQNGARRRKDRKKNGFSSIHYDSGSHLLKLWFIHDRNILLKLCVFCGAFEPQQGVKQPLSVSVTCADCHGPLASAGKLKHLEGTLKVLCLDLSSAAASNNASLFSVVSRLLHSLQTLPSLDESALNANDYTADAAAHLRLIPPSHVCNLDLGILLLRCAAASRRSATLCSPVPVAFRHKEDVLVNRILSFTNRMNMTAAERLPASSSSPCNVPTTQWQWDRSEHEFLTFLLSLPWAAAATIKTMSHEVKKQSMSTTTLGICLDMENAIGDPSPHFTKCAERYGTLRAFHGTNPENAWSILYYGLQNLSHTSMANNGAIMGTGVYLSTSYEVASFFAKTDSLKCNNPIWWRHPAFLRLLPIPNHINLEECTMSCHTVFEATILAPPAATNKEEKDDSHTRREGKYFVVPNSENIRITKLHLSFHLVKKTRLNSSVMVWLLMVLVATAAYIMHK